MFQYNIKILVDTPFDKKYSILSIEEKLLSQRK